jgi:hypothetical protein
MKKILFITFLCCTLTTNASTKDTLTVQSPNGVVSVKVWMSNQLMYKVIYQNKVLTGNSVIDLIQLYGKALS